MPKHRSPGTFGMLEAIGGVFLLIGWVGVDGGFILIAWQGYTWFDTAIWHPITIADILGFFGVYFEATSHLGWNKILLWMLGHSGTALMIVVGLIAFVVGFGLQAIGKLVTESRYQRWAEQELGTPDQGQ